MNIKQDRNFDDLVDIFEQRIYGSMKGQLRELLLWEQMQQHFPLQQRSLAVLDAAGGLGQMSARLAQLGHAVTLNDLSENMLAKARLRLQDYPINYHCGSVQTLAEQDQHYDLIVCHALLEWLADPKPCLQALIDCLTPGGYLSLAFYNRHALTFQHARMCNIDILLDESEKKRKSKGLSPGNAQFPETVLAWLQQWPVTVLAQYGIRCVVESIPREQVGNYSLEQLAAIERRFNDRLPYLYTGRYCHVLVQKNPID